MMNDIVSGASETMELITAPIVVALVSWAAPA
ncbi:hypothetical protein ACVIIV_006490 [Bradyrhizobium sp. USDA 4354]